MRGKPSGITGVTTEKRITPADAGKTVNLQIQRKAAQDHPRGCGENSGMFALLLLLLGSPPRMRGKLYLPVGGSRYKGITPADAGKTVLVIRFGMPMKDHPRGCGENTKKIL